MFMSSRLVLLKNIVWSAIDKLSMNLIQLVTTVIMARFVSPSDFGVVALINVFLVVSQIFVDSGLNIGLVQKRCEDKITFSSVFYFNLSVSFVLYFIFFFLSPFIADFYGKYELTFLIRVAALNIIVSAFSYIQKTILVMRYELKSQAKITFVSMMLAAMTGVFLAINDFGVWALIAQTLLFNVLSTVLLFTFSYWSPALTFSFQSIKGIFSYSYGIMFTSLFQVLYNNLYTLLIAKFYSSSAVGFYNRSQTIVELVSSNIFYIIQRPYFVYQCDVKDNKKLSATAFIDFLRMSMLMILPILVGGAVLADSIIVSLLTEKWIAAIPIFRILCVSSLFSPIILTNMNIFKVVGESGKFLKLEVIKKVIAILILLFTINKGVLFICYGLFISNIIDLIITTLFSFKVTGISIMYQLKSTCDIIFSSFLMGVFLWILSLFIESCIIEFVVGLLSGAFIYALLLLLMKNKEIYNLYNSFILKYM